MQSGSNLEFSSVGFGGEGKTGVSGENLSEQEDNKQQTQLKIDAAPGIEPEPDLVGGECSHHCTKTY